MTTDTNQPEPNIVLYVERSTGLIYEAQLFTTCVIYRPATLGFQDVLKKVSHSEFVKEFDEFLGNPREFYAVREGQVETLTVR